MHLFIQSAILYTNTIYEKGLHYTLVSANESMLSDLCKLTILGNAIETSSASAGPVECDDVSINSARQHQLDKRERDVETSIDGILFYLPGWGVRG